MKKWEYDVLIRAKWDINLDFETKRLAHLILERESKLVKEQICLLESKESVLSKKLEELKEELRKVRRGIDRLEYKDNRLWDFKMKIE